MDTQLVEHLNHWFTANSLRPGLCRALATVSLVLIGAAVGTIAGARGAR